ncbi:OmpA family protein [Castellaniella sp. FW104-16D08]|uniref:OmpA family protein n=1 Tax=unclassified Castellaniella TaxID=2617606 RepID=UPI003315370D
MKSGPVELQPAREFMQRMQELEAELQRARKAAHRHRTSPDATARWGLEPRPAPEHEEGWFLTYLDMMTLLLVVMIVMLAFSGGLVGGLSAPGAPGRPASPTLTSVAPVTGNHVSPAPAALPDSQADTASTDIPAPDTTLPYPAAPEAAFEQSAYPDHATAVIASAYPTPADLAPPPKPQPPATPAPGPEPAAASAVSPDTPAPNQPATTQAPTTPVAGSTAAQATTAPKPAVAQTTDTPSHAPANPPPAKPAGPSEGQALAAALPLDELGSEVEVVVNQRSVSLRINNEILFGTGQADLSTHGSDVLKRMAEVLAKGGYNIVVEGHTDSIPVRGNGRYPSNWELSTARAGSVVRYLLANGVDKAHLKAVGYADTRPIASNKDTEGRAKNRRVELVIEKPAANDKPLEHEQP